MGGNGADERAAERLADLAHALLRARPGEPGRVAADLSAVRAEVERVVALREAGRSDLELLPPLRQALAAAGLAEIAPESAPLAAIEAGLARLHGLVAALAVTKMPKR